MLLRLTVSQVVRETSDSVTIHFPQPKVHKIWYKAGQFITLAVEIAGEKHFRSYSICTAPRLDDTLAITVKRLAGGLVSNYLNNKVKEGDSFDAMRPSGRFLIENSVKFQRRIFLIGGGSGITPLFSILRSVLFNEPKSQVVLFNANSSKDDIIFHEELKRLDRIFPERFQLFHFISSQTEKEGNYYPGRLEESIFLQLLSEIRQDSADWEEERFYICGPEGLMAEAKRCLALAQVAPEQMHEEHFFTEELEIASEQLSGESHDVRVSFAGKTYDFTVPPGTSILQAALQQNIPLPYSCRRGICSTCMGKQLAGKLHMAKNEALTDWEVEQGFVLTCQSFLEGDGVEVRV